MKSKPLTLILVTVLLFAALTLHAPARTNSNLPRKQGQGLLLALRKDTTPGREPKKHENESSNFTSYRTLWIFPTSSDFGILQADRIIVSRKDEFWEAGTFSSIGQNQEKVEFYASPLGKKQTTPFDPDPDMKSSFILETVYYIGSDYACIGLTGFGFKKDSKNPWALNHLKTVSLDNPSKPTGIQEVLGQDAFLVLRESARKYLQQNPDKLSVLSTEAANTSWGLMRRGGEWLIHGLLTNRPHISLHGFAYFDVPLKPPVDMVGEGPSGLSFNTIRKNFPAAVDAFISPKGDLLGIMTNDELLLYNASGTINYEKPNRRVTLQERETIVSIQWSPESETADWTKRLRKFMK